MVNIEDQKYKNLTKKDRDKFLDKLKINADKRLDDAQSLIDIITNYKAKLLIEKAKN